VIDKMSELRIELAAEANNLEHWVVLCLRKKIGVPTIDEANKICAEKNWQQAALFREGRKDG
jgi:hypothetical protein